MPVPRLPDSGSRFGAAVDLGGLHFNQDADVNGVEHWLENLDGWDSPTLREDIEDRTIAHGAHRGESFYGVRELTASGSLLSLSGLPALRAALDELVYETDLTDTDALLTVHEAPPKFVVVRRSGRLRYKQLTDHLLTFEVDLTAADPRKYAFDERALQLVNGEYGEIHNTGTFRGGAPMRIMFSDDGVLQIGSQSIGVTGTGGALVYVDTLEETVLAGGLTAYGSLAPGSTFPTLPARSTTTCSYTGNGYARLTWRDTWI